MKKKILVSLTSFWFIVASASAQEEDSIASILSRVQKNVAELKARTADFVCGEAVYKYQDAILKINFIMQSTAQEPKNYQHTSKNMRHIPSVSDGKSARISSSSWEDIVAESDDVKTIARASVSNKKLKDYDSLNGFDSLFSWFDKENEKCFNFEFLGSETNEGRNVYKIRAKAIPIKTNKYGRITGFRKEKRREF